MASFRRRQYLVKLGLQLRYLGVILLAMFAVMMVVGWTVYSTIWKQITIDPNLTMDKLIVIFREGNQILLQKLVFLAILVGILSIFISHKIAGPVYRFEKSAEIISKGDLSLRIKLRKGDELQDLADAFNKMTESLENLVFQDRKNVLTMLKLLKEIKEKFNSKKQLTEEEKQYLLKEMENILDNMQKLTSTFKLSQSKEKILEDLSKDV